MNDFMLEYSQQLNSFELEVGMYEHINVSEGNPEGNLWGPLYIFPGSFRSHDLGRTIVKLSSIKPGIELTPDRQWLSTS